MRLISIPTKGRGENSRSCTRPRTPSGTPQVMTLTGYIVSTGRSPNFTEGHFRQNIGALLPREPRDHSDERAIDGIRRQAEFLHQLPLASLFSTQIAGGV